MKSLRSVSLLTRSPRGAARRGHGFCLQRKLIEGIDKLAKNTTTAPPQRGREEAEREGEIDLIDDSSNAVGKECR